MTKKKQMLLIINPRSGREKIRLKLLDILDAYTGAGYQIQVHVTQKSLDARDAVLKYGGKKDLIVCSGGDGTLNEVISGMMELTKPVALGYIPAGSTNDFAACHGISSDMLEAAQNIISGKPKKIDIGKFGDQYFSYVAAFGAFSWLSYTTPQNLKNMLGHSAYLLDAVKDLPKIKAHHLKLDVGEFTCEGDYIFGAVCNSTSVAGTITLPKTVVDTGDGKFEILLVHEPRTLIDFQNILIGVFTQDYSSPFLDFFQADSVKISSPEGLDWSLDGELGKGSEKHEIANLADRLTLIC